MKKIILITLTISLTISLFSCSETDDFNIENTEFTEISDEVQACCDGNEEIPPPPPDDNN
ncbi:hypothetical protein [Polaribacter sp. R77954]|uniref:hypothetical protein n=1 Tax=Polaribacter sp. R77954 TaxID=3093870 RepID=UPI0037C771C0